MELHVSTFKVENNAESKINFIESFNKEVDSDFVNVPISLVRAIYDKNNNLKTKADIESAIEDISNLHINNCKIEYYGTFFLINCEVYETSFILKSSLCEEFHYEVVEVGNEFVVVVAFVTE
jgi:hypothetical protein